MNFNHPMEIKYGHFKGLHCETTATGNLLKQQGLNISEPMMFGLGEGLNFICLNLSSLNLPFIGGRTKPFEITQTLCKNLSIDLFDSETTSRKNAESSLLNNLNGGRCVGLQLDSYYLDHFSSKVHFAGHFIAVYGFDEHDYLVVDTEQQGGKLRCSRHSVEEARFAKGPMSSKARAWTIELKSTNPDLAKAIPKAIRNNARAYLNPAFKGASFLGIEKMSKSLPKWIELAKVPSADLSLSALLMERAGTGGSIFRNFYRDFLLESYDIVGVPEILNAHGRFGSIAKRWLEVSVLIEEAGKSSNPKYLHQASVICEQLGHDEKEAMEILARIE